MLAIIPARGGSKGVPKKNIRKLGGKPLIYWTIEAALEAKSIDRVILSTDNEEIANICKKTGIEIPFMRPSNLAKDDSLAIDNYIYTIEKLASSFKQNYKEFVVLQPTTPLRNALDIDNAVELFFKKDAESVISCVEFKHPLGWLFTINHEGSIIRNQIIETKKMMNRQNISSAYIPNGGVSVFSYSLIKKKYSYYSKKSFAYVMPPERSVDIDTELDFEFIKFLVYQKTINDSKCGKDNLL